MFPEPEKAQSIECIQTPKASFFMQQRPSPRDHKSDAAVRFQVEANAKAQRATEEPIGELGDVGDPRRA